MAKFGSAAERGALVEEVLPRLVDLAKNPYGHFLICKLLASATKQTLAGAARNGTARVHGDIFTMSWGQRWQVHLQLRGVQEMVKRSGKRCVCQ